jgi:signal transduction histidine kinase
MLATVDGGEAGALLRRRDWSSTSLGPIADWPASLTVSVASVLQAPVPMVLLWGGDGVMIYNDAYAAFAGSHHPALFGAPMGALWPEMGSLHEHGVRQGLEGLPLVHLEQELTLDRFGAAEAAWCDLYYTPVRDDIGEPAGALCVLVDITERILAERGLVRELQALGDGIEQQVGERAAGLVRAERALRQTEKMDAVAQLTGGLAHDFNNLLAGISGSFEMIALRLMKGRLADVEKYVAAGQSASRRAAALTQRLQAFARGQALSPRPTDVNALVGGLLDRVRQNVGPDIEIRMVATDALWPALVDPSELEDAILSLCSNARDAMPAGGGIVIMTAMTTFDGATAADFGLPVGEYLSLSVTDTGAGMTPDVAARALDPFFTTKSGGEGTGLGLSMVYAFARQSGGQIRIDSRPGGGTTVSLYLPRHSGEAGRIEPDGGEAILVIDGEVAVHETTQSL